MSSVSPPGEPSVVGARRRVERREWIVLSILVGAVALLICNGTSFFHRLSDAGDMFGPGLKVAWIALTLNVALILFGWRRYADLQHEAERRDEHAIQAQVLASNDTMTGLLNRKGFADAGEGLRGFAAEAGLDVVIGSIQLHRFKFVNDRHGYDVGDSVLRGIAHSIRDRVRADCLVARICGDEFAVALALPKGELPSAYATAAAVLESVTRPFEVEGSFVQVGAYVGLASADPSECTLPDLLRRAEIAMNHSRSTRSARPSWFDAGMERALIAHTEIEQGIRYGLEHDQFVPYFEPQVDLRSGAIIGFEVLARWDHPLSGIIAPDRFIGIAEEMGLIGKLSEQVVRKALGAACHWDPAVSLAINISPSQLADSWLAQKVVRLLTETGFPAERLVVEITESSLFADLELARAIVTSLKAQGIRLALDDFGSGFSSLSHLRALPFDMIKIDRSFIATVSKDRQSAAIVKAVSSLAQAIDVPVTVEGIEDAATQEAVVAMGCAMGQGWYFGKAMGADDAAQLLRNRQSDLPAPRASAAR